MKKKKRLSAKEIDMLSLAWVAGSKFDAQKQWQDIIKTMKEKLKAKGLDESQVTEYDKEHRDTFIAGYGFGFRYAVRTASKVNKNFREVK